MNCPQCGYSTDKKQRSNQQNKAYWKLIIEPLSEHLALERPRVHEMLKYKFLQEIRYTSTRKGTMEEFVVVKSSTSLTTKDFEEYCSQIRIWASNLGCYLLEPNEVSYAATNKR